MPPTVVEPPDAAALAALLAHAGASGQTVVPRGSGTKLTWSDAGTLPDVYLSTRRLTSPVAHYAGDLVATIPAGFTLADANAVLRLARQWLPFDPPHADRATIGGIVATNDSGPRRHAYGTPRDLIIGIEFALADGRLAKAGGRVVKNVAGYDLARLFCGSHGSLGVVTSATFKLAPTPPASRTVLAQPADVATALELARTIANAPVTPSAIEVETPSPRLLVRFETTAPAADRMAATTCELSATLGVPANVLAEDDEQEAWDAHERVVWGRPGSVVKISTLPADLASVFDLLARARGVEWSAVGRAALGVLLVRLNGSIEDEVAAINGMRTHVERARGYVSVLEARRDVRTRTQASAGVGGAAALVRAIKARFNPGGVLPAPELERRTSGG